MTKIYLDNAATTQLRKEVVDTMVETLQNDFGNPSSTHSFGRSAKTIVETSRKKIAKYLGCQAQEVVFTSNATEASNWILRSVVKDLGVVKIITSSIEHHATLFTIKALQKEFNIDVVYIPVLSSGSLDYTILEKEITTSVVKTLVSLMHVNNETGVVLDIDQVGKWCVKHNVLFHCDTVQSIGKTEIDLHNISVDFIVASAHKFHGPKGVGFAYIKKNIVLQPFILGGEQEKGWRAGTEATHQIAGMARALELAYENLDDERTYITALKAYTIEKLKTVFPEVKVNGDDTFYNILNILLPFSEEKTAFILFNLDMKGIAVSRGSACQSGSIKPSHVLAAFLSTEEIKKPSLRVSFSHYNTQEEIDMFIQALQII